MKKITIVVLAIFPLLVKAQTLEPVYGLNPYLDKKTTHSNCVPLDTTAHLLRNAIDHISTNDYGIKKVYIGWWDEFSTNYWLTYDDKDHSYVLSRMHGNQALVSVRLLPRPDGHGFNIAPGIQKTGYLLREVSKLLSSRNVVFEPDCDN